jgi:hypothetical protein
MEKVTIFLNKFGMVIMVPLILIIFLKTCSTSRNVEKMDKEIKTTIVTKTEIKTSIDSLSTTITTNLTKEIKIEGLRAEYRAIAASDRKIFDKERQAEIRKEIIELQK